MRTVFNIMIAAVLLTILPSCNDHEPAVTQTSEVVVLDDAPIPSSDPFDKEFLVDGERALRPSDGIAPPRLVSRGPKVTFPSSSRNICFPSASIIVVVDKHGSVRETEIVSVAPAFEYVGGETVPLTVEESRALIEEREWAIHNWQFDPATKDGKPVPSVTEGGWRMFCR